MANRRLDIDEKGPERPKEPATGEVSWQEAPLDLLRVDFLRSALAAKEYVVDPQRIADKLLKFERGLPRS